MFTFQPLGRLVAGSSFGKAFKLTTFGESHGPALGAVVDGCPPGLAIAEEDIQSDLDRRRPGRSKFTTARQEADQVRILSGVFEGLTTGTPIGLAIENTDARSRDYSKIKDVYRPSHADFAYDQKYGIRDYRGGGRASARETAMRVAAGAIAKKYLKERHGILVRACVSQVGDLIAKRLDWDIVETNPFFCPDESLLEPIAQLIDELREAGDSTGASVTVMAEGVPAGLGEPVFDKLDAEIARALMSINAVKGVEIGEGFGVSAMVGSAHRDQMDESGFQSNRAGGILGGISTGEPLIARMALKPTSSIAKAGTTRTTGGEVVQVSTTGRHDPCVGLRAPPIAEAMLALVLMDHWLRQAAQNGAEVSLIQKRG